MRYLAVQVANCGEGPFRQELDRLVVDLENNYPIVVQVKQVVLDNIPFEDVEKLS